MARQWSHVSTKEGVYINVQPSKELEMSEFDKTKAELSQQQPATAQSADTISQTNSESEPLLLCHMMCSYVLYVSGRSKNGSDSSGGV